MTNLNFNLGMIMGWSMYIPVYHDSHYSQAVIWDLLTQCTVERCKKHHESLAIILKDYHIRHILKMLGILFDAWNTVGENKKRLYHE